MHILPMACAGQLCPCPLAGLAGNAMANEQCLAPAMTNEQPPRVSPTIPNNTLNNISEELSYIALDYFLLLIFFFNFRDVFLILSMRRSAFLLSLFCLLLRLILFCMLLAIIFRIFAILSRRFLLLYFSRVYDLRALTFLICNTYFFLLPNN